MLLCQWANSLGGIVIGTVSTKEKATEDKEDGYHHVIVTKEENFAECVTKITSGKGVDVVYDSVGKDTFEVIYKLLLPFSLLYCCNKINYVNHKTKVELTKHV